MEIDVNSEGFKMGIEIGKIRKKILDLPLNELLQQANTWESITPFTDPTLYMQERNNMADFKRNISILARAKNAFLKEDGN